MNPSASLNSSIESLSKSLGDVANLGAQAAAAASATSSSTSSNAAASMTKTANFLSQLETMMNAVKKEASALEGMKAKLREMEDLKNKYNEAKNRIVENEQESNELRRKIREYEQLIYELRGDMQRLNDIYNTDRLKFQELQQQLQRVEQELHNSKMEKDFYIKELEKLPEMKKSVKTHKTQLTQMKQSFEEEKIQMQNTIQDQDKKLQKLEKNKQEINEHLWILTEENEKKKKEISEKSFEINSLKSSTLEMKEIYEQKITRHCMIIEDFKLQNNSKFLQLKSFKQDVVSLQKDKRQLLQDISALQEQIDLKDEKFRQLEALFQEKSLSSDMSLTTLQDGIKEAQQKNGILLQENTHLKTSVLHKEQEIHRCVTELRNLQEKSMGFEQSVISKEVDYQNTIKGLMSLKEDLMNKVQNLNTQYDSLKATSQEEKQKLITEIKKYQTNEQHVIEEAEKLQTELNEKLLIIHNLENNKFQQEKLTKNELQDHSQMITTLREELEKRVSELVNLRQERDSLQMNNDTLSKQAEEMHHEIVRLDSLMKKTLENEKNKLKNELLQRNQRNKLLENEKMELLKETEELMRQTHQMQAEKSDLLKTMDENKQELLKIREEQGYYQLKTQEYSKQQKQNEQTISTLQQQLQRVEDILKQEQQKMDQQLRENKKQFSSQLLEMSNNYNGLSHELEEKKKIILANEEKIQNLQLDKQHKQLEYEKLMKQHQEIQSVHLQEKQQIYYELQEYRQKLKIMQEMKLSLEKEIMNFQLHCQSLEHDKQTFCELSKTYETNFNKIQDEFINLQSAHESAVKELKSSQNKLQEFENLLNQKNYAIEQMTNELHNTNTNMNMELRRYKLMITSYEQEINELKLINQQVTKELSDYKMNQNKLVTAHNTKVNHLFEEITNLETLLTQEKRSKKEESTESYSLMQELKFTTEQVTIELQEMKEKYKLDNLQSTKKLQLLEEELQRNKGLLREKDSKIEEHEKSHISSKQELLILKERIHQLEHQELMELQNQLENETNYRKRLEGRLRAMSIQTAELENAANSTAVVPNSGATNSIASGSSYSSNNLPRSRGNMFFRDETTGGLVGNLDSTLAGLHAGNDMSYSNSGMLSARSYLTTTTNSNNLISFTNNGYTANLPPLNINDTVNYGTDESSNPYQSPARSHHVASNNAMGAASPAVDRVSATLALKLAQQQRNNIPMTGSNMSQNLPNSNVSINARNTRPMSGNHKINGGAFPINSGILQQENLLADLPDYYESNIQTNNSNNPSNDVVEESIRRTQMVLNRRLGMDGGAKQQLSNFTSGNSYGVSNSSVDDNASTGTNKTPNSGRSAVKLMETIQHAHNLYPPSSPQQFERELNNVNISTPNLQPATPPREKIIPDDFQQNNALAMRFQMNASGMMDLSNDFSVNGNTGSIKSSVTNSSNQKEDEATLSASASASEATSKKKKKTKKGSTASDSTLNGVQLPRIPK